MKPLWYVMMTRNLIFLYSTCWTDMLTISGSIAWVYKTLGTSALSMTEWPGEIYDPLLMLPVKSTSNQCRWSGGDGLAKYFKSWDNWDKDCVCMPFRGWMGKTKYLSVFERGMVVGARRTGLSVSRTATLLRFSCLQFPVCIKNGPPSKGHPANLTTVGSIGVNMGQHPCWTHSTPCRVHTQTNWDCSESKRECNSILGRCS